ncbi:hypothetical protein KHU50_002732 [Colletotrichum sp. SAR 10_65]|nr:hypothetical protein KHU50_002732 [Colletotrichum sp. SAR 10_65]KAI8186408.1 hypothetical protein K4K51_010467 [Colletotrichum sp. SAR 10_75]KAI8246059.1 hypothetical protein K4K53_002608 [Colletotrichum sp. SAR 10_77]
MSEAFSPEPPTTNELQTDTSSPAEAFPPVPPEPESKPETPARDWKRRASLFRSKSSQEARRKDKRRQTILVSPEAEDRMSRANSMTWESQKDMDQARQLQVDSWLVPGNRQSINYNLMSYESRRLLNLSEDLAACEENSIMSDSKFEASPFQVTANTMPSTPAGGRSRLNSIEGGFMALNELIEAEPMPELLPPPVQEPVERALTPSDMDYRPLGTMKFGSLRITNGEASPLPSPDLEPSIEHQAMAEQLANDDLKGELEYGNYEVEITVSPVQRGATPKGLGPIETTLLGVESPRLRTDSPELKVASKHTAMEDQLFEDDVQVEYSAEILTVRNDPNAKPSLEQLQADQSQKQYQGVVRADSGVVTSPTTEYQPNKPLSKADSGYSSNVSLRSFHAKPNATGKDRPARVTTEQLGDEKSVSNSSPLVAVPAISTINIDQVAIDAAGSDSASSTPPPVPPKNDSMTLPNTNTMTITSPRHLQFFNLARRDRKTTFDMAKAAESGPTSPQPAESSATDSDKPSTMTIGSGSQRASKFQRFLTGSGMRGPPAVHDTHAANDAVPTVPQDVQTKLEEHSGRFPLSARRLTLRTRESKDTLKTIFSVGSVEIGQSDAPDLAPIDRKIVVRKPVPQASEASEIPKTPKTPKTPRRLSFQNVGSTIGQAAASVMPRRSIHRKPVPSASAENAKEEETKADEIYSGFESRITAIGSVSDSVGKSSFDQAFMALPQSREAERPRSASRTFTMTAQMERSMGTHLRAQGQMPSMNGDGGLAPSPRSQTFSEADLRRKTSPPVSLHTRSGKSLRKPAPLRPKSSSSSEGQQRRQSLSRQTSRETIYSYPAASPGGIDETLDVPPVPPMSPRRYTMLEQQYAMRRQASDDKWRPSNQAGLAPPRPAMRSMSTMSPAPPARQLRHRASYDGYSQQYRGPVARGPPPMGQSASQSGAYYQQQLLNIEQQHWEQEEDISPDNVQPGLHRTRSRSRSVHASGNPPYRVLHSYNSPAYRNVPIWG